MKIGFNSYSYPEQRCIINKVKSCEYIFLPRIKYLKTISFIDKKLNKKNISKYQYIHKNYSDKEIDAYHFFNYISKSSKPYITTFETFLPRIQQLSYIHHTKDCELETLNLRDIENTLKILANNNCKQIIALSKCNYNMQKDLLNLYGDMGNIILEKMIQINPPQNILINSYSEKNLDKDSVRFIFIGRDFVRKGGIEVVRAFYNIVSKYNFKLELILIGDINNTYNYSFKSFQDSHKDIEEVNDIIIKSNWITLYKELSNKKVIDLIKESHIGLLPTWADTYGYSVLEFQALGVPVISTNIRALSEINNNECGWIIDLPTNKFGELAIDSLEYKNRLRHHIISKLEVIIKYILENKDCISIKGSLCLDRIKSEHSPDLYSDKLENIYRELLTI